MATNTVTTSVQIVGNALSLTKATKTAKKDMNSLSGVASKVSGKINGALATIGVGISFAAIGSALSDATRAAVEDAKGQALLANQMQNTTKATKDEIAATEKSISKLSVKAAIADDKLRPAYATLLRTTKDNTKATELLNLVTDISAGSGKDLTSVTMALSKAYQGKFAALTKLGVPMSDSIQNASDYAKEMKKLNQLQAEAANSVGPDHAKALQKVAEQQDKVNRIAEAGIDWQKDLGDAFKNSAELAAAKDPYQKLEIIFGELKETIGAALLPALEKVAKWFSDNFETIQNNISAMFNNKAIKDITDAVFELFGAFGDFAKSDAGKAIGFLISETVIGGLKVLAGTLQTIVDSFTIIEGKGFGKNTPIGKTFTTTKQQDQTFLNQIQAMGLPSNLFPSAVTNNVNVKIDTKANAKDTVAELDRYFNRLGVKWR